MSNHAPLWPMAHKKVNILSKRKKEYKFQAVCMSYSKLKQNKSLKEKVDKYFSSQFYSKNVNTTGKNNKTVHNPCHFSDHVI